MGYRSCMFCFFEFFDVYCLFRICFSFLRSLNSPYAFLNVIVRGSISGRTCALLFARFYGFYFCSFFVPYGTFYSFFDVS
jgi:hypothetical protein